MADVVPVRATFGLKVKSARAVLAHTAIARDAASWVIPQVGDHAHLLGQKGAFCIFFLPIIVPMSAVVLSVSFRKKALISMIETLPRCIARCIFDSIIRLVSQRKNASRCIFRQCNAMKAWGRGWWSGRAVCAVGGSSRAGRCIAKYGTRLEA